MGEIGYFSILLAFILSVYSVFVSFFGIKHQRMDFIKSGERSVFAVCGLLIIASIGLFQALITRDFRNEYVASYSNSSLSFLYTLSAFWAGQKGSLLLWALLVSIFSCIVIYQNQQKNRILMPYVTAILMFISLFFTGLMAFATNPFETLSFMPQDGRGLNPLLQNPGMLIHPPTLYLGFVGFSIPFAFAVAALLTRQLGDEWIKSTRRWTIFSWFFLTAGNLFGAQWAYVELGWGGYWAWDPVENASFIPWLTGTAFLHSVMIQEKRDMLKVWNMALIITTFLLTIFGTFITRSGLIGSVHSFGESSLGYFFLVFLSVIAIFSLNLLLSRLDLLKSKNEFDSFLSRESSFLFNNLLFLAAAFAIFWGTIFPIISEAVRGVKITVGPPFFNQVILPIGILLLLVTGICPLIGWKKSSYKNLIRNFLIPFLTFLLVGFLLLIFGLNHIYAIIIFSLSAFVLSTVFLEFYKGTKARKAISGEKTFKALMSLVGKNKRRYGGYIIHIGAVMMFVAIAGSNSYNQEVEKTLKKGQSLSIKDYTLVYQDFSSYPTQSKNLFLTTLSVYKKGKHLGYLRPEKNLYRDQEQPTTEVAIRSTLLEDLYVILAAFDQNGIVTFKVLVRPLVIWLWIGGFFMALGTIIAMWPDKKAKKEI